MASSKLAYRAFMLLGLVSFLIVAVFLAYIGIFGLAGQNLLRQAWAPVEEFYRSNQPASDVVLTAMGVIVSAAFATFATVKTWHYAETQLPNRVEDFIQDEIEWFRQRRPAIVAVLRSGAEPQAFLEPTARTKRFNAALQSWFS